MTGRTPTDHWHGAVIVHSDRAVADRLVPAVRESPATGRPVHVVAEPDVTTHPGAPVDRTAAYFAHESICRESYAAYGCRVTCVWDARVHSTLSIENVRALHDHELTAAGPVPSETWAPSGLRAPAGRPGVAPDHAVARRLRHQLLRPHHGDVLDRKPSC